MKILTMALMAGVSYAASADLVLLNGKVWTVNPSQPRAEAVACRGGRIAAAGTTAEIRKWIDGSTKVIDLKGRLLLPGFNDAHVHFYTGGRNLAGVQLRKAKSQAEFRERIREFAAKLPKGRWITGGDWDHENWKPADLPTRQLIDAVTPDHPVLVSRLDGHMALANTRGAEAGGDHARDAGPARRRHRARRRRRPDRRSEGRCHGRGRARNAAAGARGDCRSDTRRHALRR